MADENPEHDSWEYRVLYMYRQGARQAGVGMMIGPPIIAAVAVGFVWILFWPRFTGILVRLFLCSFFAFFPLLAVIFFVVGLRRVIYGGAWGCVIDPKFLTWSYPERCGWQGQSVALREIRRMEIVGPVVEGDFDFFIVTDAQRLPIHSDCFGRLVPFIRALLQANPAIEVNFIQRGPTRLLGWGRIEVLNAEARARCAERGAGVS